MEQLLSIALLPVVLLCYFIYQKDANKEPSELLKRLFGYGCLTVIPVIFLEILLSIFFPTSEVTDFMMLFINVFVSVALVEEGFKWLVVKYIGFDNNEFDEIYDSIVYSVFVSLGFACIENIKYVFLNGFATGIIRALTAVPGHTSFGVIMGYFFAKAKVNQMNQNHGLYSQNMIFSLLIPSLLHSIYDTIALYSYNAKSSVCMLLFYVFIIILFVCCFIIVQKISKVQSNVSQNVSTGNIIYNQGTVSMNTSQINLEVINQAAQTNSPQQAFQSNSPNFCPICGKPAHGKNFCSFCGYRLKI